jgi:Uncharacterised protein family (UPF0193)
MSTAAQCCTELSPCPLGWTLLQQQPIIELPYKRWFAAGAGGWADPLASRTAQRQPASSALPGCRRVPRPKMQLNIASVAMGPASRLSRKPHDTIIASNCYAREQYVRLRPIEDAAAKRQHDQSLFEHGKKKLNEMQQLAAQPPQSQSQVLDVDRRQALIDQVLQAHTAHAYVCMWSCSKSATGCLQRPVGALQDMLCACAFCRPQLVLSHISDELWKTRANLCQTFRFCRLHVQQIHNADCH